MEDAERAGQIGAAAAAAAATRVNVWYHSQPSTWRMAPALRSVARQPPTFTRLLQACARGTCQSRCSGAMRFELHTHTHKYKGMRLFIFTSMRAHARNIQIAQTHPHTIASAPTVNAATAAAAELFTQRQAHMQPRLRATAACCRRDQASDSNAESLLHGIVVGCRFARAAEFASYLLRIHRNRNRHC